MSEKLIPEVSTISDNIIDIIKSSKNNIINIVGESGTGKSFLLNNLIEEIQDKKRELIVLKGDSSKKEMDFYPLDEFLIKTIKVRQIGKDVVSKLFEEIPIVGKSLATILDNVDVESYMHKENILDIAELRRHGEFSLYLLSALHKESEVFIFCDDIQYFDNKTLIYLNDTIIKFKNHGYSTIKFISTINTSNITSYEQSYFEGESINFILHLPSKDEINDLMSFWGLNRTLTNEEVEMVYASTGGHLYLLYSIMEYLQFSNNDENKSIINCKSLLSKIIETRLFSFGSSYQEAKNVLCCLSYIGEQVSKNEISCVLNNPDYLNKILNILSTQNLLTIKDDYVFFCHEIIRKALSNLNSENSITFYSKFAVCVKNISPSHYAKRAIIETKAGNVQQADILFSLYACQKMRSGLFFEIKDIVEKFSSDISFSLKDSIEELTVAYQLAFKGNGVEALTLLSSTNCAYPYPLWIEKQYLFCTLQFKNNNKNERIEALQTIKELVSNTQNDEFEIWSRCVILKQILESELGLLEEAKKTRNMFQYNLSERFCYDIESRKTLNILDLYSDTIDTHEVAHSKLLKLVSKLETEVQNKNYDSIFDLYIAESNLSGNSLIIGDYKTAYESAFKAGKIVEQFTFVHFSHQEVWRNNMYMALYNMGQTEKQDIIDEYKKIFAIKTDEDRILIITNYAGLLFTCDDYKSALKIINQINKSEVDIDMDAYYVYYYKFNLALILYFNGFKSEAINQLEEIKEFVSCFPKTVEKYYIKHYEIVFHLLSEKKFESIEDLQSDFTNKVPIFLSSIWNKFKYVYLFSDLQIWTHF